MSNVEFGRTYRAQPILVVVWAAASLALALLVHLGPFEPLRSWLPSVILGFGVATFLASFAERLTTDSLTLDDHGIRLGTDTWETVIAWSDVVGVRRRRGFGLDHLVVEVASKTPETLPGTVRSAHRRPTEAERSWSRCCAANRALFHADVVVAPWRYGLPSGALHAALEGRRDVPPVVAAATR